MLSSELLSGEEIGDILMFLFILCVKGFLLDNFVFDNNVDDNLPIDDDDDDEEEEEEDEEEG